MTAMFSTVVSGWLTQGNPNSVRWVYRVVSSGARCGAELPSLQASHCRAAVAALSPSAGLAGAMGR
jgi:hypothetical protein